MAVGLPAKTTYVDGDVFSASDINDTNGTLNLVGQTTNFYAGKNKIINGDFNIWQRGTSQTLTVDGAIYGSADRWGFGRNGDTSGTNTVSRQTHTVGQTDVPNNPTYFCRWTSTTLSVGQTRVDFNQLIENVGTFANETCTLSFWVKASGTFGISTFFEQNFGSGGSAAVTTTTGTGNTSTSWTRFTTTVTLPSISGKTVGASNYLRVLIRFNNPTAGATFDVSNVQLEAGSTATAFQTATGTIQGELAACQRYYYRAGGASAFTLVAPLGYLITTTLCRANIQLPVSMRTTPTSVDFSTIEWVNFGTAQRSITAVTINTNFSSNFAVVPELTLASTDAIYNTGYIRANNSTSGYLGFSAEL